MLKQILLASSVTLVMCSSATMAQTATVATTATTATVDIYSSSCTSDCATQSQCISNCNGHSTAAESGETLTQCTSGCTPPNGGKYVGSSAQQLCVTKCQRRNLIFTKSNVKLRTGFDTGLRY